MTKKRLLFLLVLLCMTGMYSMAEPISVSTAAELQTALKNNPTGHIHITQDIDLSTWTPVSGFQGTLEGEILSGENVPYLKDENGNNAEDASGNAIQLVGHRITGLKKCMFSSLDGATIHHIYFEGISYATSGTETQTNGVLASEAKNATFEYLAFNKCAVERGTTLTAAPNYVGLVAGKATNCKLTGVSVSRSTIAPEGDLVGSMVGLAKGCTFAYCSTDILTMVYGEAESNARIGGICGSAVKNDNTPCTFTECINLAVVSEGDKGDQLGGIAGYSDGASFECCHNYGAISHVSNKSEWESWKDKLITNGIAGGAYSAVENAIQSQTMLAAISAIESGNDYMACLRNCMTNYGQPLLTSRVDLFIATSVFVAALEVAWIIYQCQDPDEVGGICGCANDGSFLRCGNGGYIHSYDAYSGGIVGRATGTVTISHCYNMGKVVGDEQVGGIVGSLNGSGSTITACLNTGAFYADEDTQGPIYGQLSGGATSGGSLYTIGNTESTSADGIQTVNYQTLASGQVAKAINDNTGTTYWRQKVGERLVPQPSGCNDEPLPGAEGNAIDANASSAWVTVNTAKELEYAIADPYAWIKLGQDITLDKNKYGFSMRQFPFRGKVDGQEHAIKGLYHYQKISTIDEDHNTSNIGFFNYAEGATFTDLVMDDLLFIGSYNNGALVGNSKGCRYTNVTIGSATSSPFVGSSGYYVGALVGVSENDQFVHCQTQAASTLSNETTGGEGNIYADGFSSSPDANIGGLVGGAKNSYFENCINAWKVVGDDDRVGGIVGNAENCTFVQCINYERVQHQNPNGFDDELGGIVGYAKGCTISQCTSYGECLGADAYIGGIVGFAEENTTIRDCLSYCTVHGDYPTGGVVGYINKGNMRNCLVLGTVYKFYDETQLTGWDKLFGEQENSKWANNYIRHDTYDAGSGGRALVTSQQLESGQVAWWLNESKESTVWRQNLTGEYPDGVPVLDQTHDLVTQGSLTKIRFIVNEADLIQFRQDVANATGAAMETVVLAEDIRLTENWIPIGTVDKVNPDDKSSYKFTHAFSGKFLGCGHTISNINVTGDESYHGFFGAVTNGAVISDLIVEGTITGSNGVGGIVGAAEATSAGTVTILRCGNRATVTATDVNAGGIIGAVYNSDDIELVVEDCWNTGAVTGKQSGSLCGNFKKKATFTNCWNSGAFNAGAGETNNYPYVRYSNTADQTLELVNCFQMEGLPHGSYSSATLPTFKEEDMASGLLCYAMNKYKTNGNDLVWQQNVGTDPHPVFGSKGLYHTRTMTNEYGTVCLPFDVTSDEDVAFYTLTSADDEALNFTYAAMVPAGTPCLAHRQNTSSNVRMESTGTTYASPLTMTAVNGYTPVGTYSAVTDKTGCYYVAKDKLWYATNAISIPAYRAWFEGSKPSQAIAIRIDGTTAVIALDEEDSTAAPANTDIYDLSGRRYEAGTTLAPGIYVVGGKKTVVK